MKLTKQEIYEIFRRGYPTINCTSSGFKKIRRDYLLSLLWMKREKLMEYMTEEEIRKLNCEVIAGNL